MKKKKKKDYSFSNPFFSQESAYNTCVTRTDVARAQWIYSARSRRRRRCRRRVVIHILRALHVSIACTLQYYNARSE